MTGLPATLGASDEHYRRLGVSKDHIELWEDGMRTDGGKGTYEWWYFDAYLNDGSKLAITFRTKPIIDVGKALEPSQHHKNSLATEEKAKFHHFHSKMYNMRH